jgi:ATP-dependent helicase HepA
MHSHFPGLENEGMKVTYHRDLALSNEDMHFITWEHPLAMGALDLVLSNETGNTSLIAINDPTLAAGTMYLECVYILEPMAQKTLQSKRYLPPTTIRLVVDQRGKNVSHSLLHQSINQSLIPVDAETASNVVRSQTREIKLMIAASEELASAQKPRLIAGARKQILETLEPEIERLRALKAHNPNVRSEEIEFFESQRAGINTALESANVRLDALRIIVAT